MATTTIFNDENAVHVMISVTIANGASVSDVADIRKMRVVGIRMPSAWTTASLGASESPDNGVTKGFNTIYDDGGQSSGTPAQWIVPVGASKTYLVGGALDPFRYCKLLSVNSSGVAVNQGADRVVDLICEAA